MMEILRMPRTTPPMPLPVSRALRKLGSDIRDARRRRRIQTAVMADRIQVSLPTLRRLEAGEPSVSMGVYATALYVLGLVDRVADLADLAHDPIGRRLASADLPLRIHSR
jgi:transcriptional regulator with XRE-family HTH domain